MTRFILASGSPRRHELLQELIADFQVKASEIDEVLNDSLPGMGEQVADLALQKALAVASSLTEAAWVLGADTVVYSQSEVLGKPRDAADAERMLAQLSNGWHEVITGLGLVYVQPGVAPTQWLDFACSKVQMREISPQERQSYIASGEPMDKAGAYAIQGGAGAFVTQIEGAYDNIVGLPLSTLAELLKQAGYPL